MKTILSVIAGLFLLSPNVIAGEQIELDMARFNLGKTRAASFQTIAGRDALCMDSGTALVTGHELQNGTISVDVLNSRHRHFANLVFRAVDTETYEAVYLRLHKDGQPDAAQYSPLIHAEANWQLFSPYQTRIDFGDDDWVTLRVSFADDKARAEIVTSAGEFRLPIDDLALDASGSALGLSALFPTCFSNFQISDEKPDLSTIADPEFQLGAGVITRWSLSPVYAFDEQFALPTSAEDWEIVETEANGNLLISRYRVKPSRGQYEKNDLNAIYAGVRITSETDGLVPLRFDASDIGRIYLNGQPLAEWNNSFRAKAGPLFRGDFDRAAQTIILPLKAGENDLIIGVAERANGWGLSAELMDMEGLVVHTMEN